MPVSQTMPVRLDWAIRSNISAMSCAEAKDSPGYACAGPLSKCFNSTNGPGYFCNCTDGYEGNPYIVDGCRDIDECKRPETYRCYGKCKNKPGISLGISLLIFIILFTLMMRQKRRMNEYFKKNGGSVLEKMENIKIFTKDELNKITGNNSEVLGKGGFGKVYKGTLEDNTMVAVKESIEINEAQKEDFTNEVIIQSQMIHVNIIKLLGCCLEVDVPMLVYEFAANGNLQDILHGYGSHRLTISLDLRLDIAIGSAEGLRYMHSYAKRTIRHGDIKPANILLDDKLIPKISDFGASKLLTMDKDYTMFPVGSMGYIDPVFYRTGHLTKKSDIYSFGVVLLELISRKPIIYGDNLSLIIEFLKAYKLENSGRAIFDKEIMTEESIYILEEIGRLVMECLQENVEERPDMNEVAERLVMLRRARNRKHNPQNLEVIPKLSFSAADINTNSSTTTLSSLSTLASKEFFDQSVEMDTWSLRENASNL
ncbi:hypothetical protein GUJ93_ZPchr0010g8661 [Zizania palustris]|uniref:Protein kinase domain-containing protein n=1 Tax=Zizania palustris TaxID=103762 RepID=A0A8J5WFW7_ZIZPA|nr:hypothetical protein GUJ93_ZPchr0010g8661 [Zizania palustris]